MFFPIIQKTKFINWQMGSAVKKVKDFDFNMMIRSDLIA
jgi:hypothetical protein